MARKSRFKPEMDVERIEEKQLIRTAVYARKSLEDESSLETQISLLLDYINESEDLTLHQVYADNGFTGITFERPGFQQMIEDMKAGKFQAIVVKDGSRLGRNYLEAGTYMESVFPAHGIRFISINDNYDSADVRCEKDGISIPLRNIMNEQYSKDLSRKLSSAFRTKQLSGDFIGAYATYGYQKSEKNKNRLLVDEETAPIVKHIFQRKIEGISDGKIAQELNEADILSPFAYRYAKGLVKAEKYKNMVWKKGTIAQMLTNQMYLGNMVQGRRRKSLSRREALHNTPENEWIIVKDTHEPIVSEEIFVAVQQILAGRKERYTQRVGASETEKTVNLLKGKIFCADCGRAMNMETSRSKRASHFYYRCRMFSESGGHGCAQRSVRKGDAEQAVLETIKVHCRLFTDSVRLIQKENKTAIATEKQSSMKKEISKLKKDKSHYTELAAGLYQDYSDGLLNNEEYIYASEEYKKKIAALDERIETLKKLLPTFEKNYVERREWVKIINKYEEAAALDREMVDELIGRIEVYQDGRLSITLKCMDAFREMKAVIKQRRGEIYGTEE